MPKGKSLVRAPKEQDDLMVVDKKEQLELLKQTYAKGASDTEFKMLFAVGNKVGADPLRKEIYLVPFWDNDAKRMARTPVVGIDWYRKQAGKSPNYAGQGEAEFGNDVTSNGCTHPEWAVVPIYNHRFSQPVRVRVFWNEVAKISKDGVAVSNWKTMPHTMLAKCSEAQGIRKAFPEEVGGVYIEEEMPTEIITATAIETTKTNIQAAEVKAVLDPGKVEYLGQLLQCIGKKPEAFLKFLKKDKIEDLTDSEADSWIEKMEKEIKAKEGKDELEKIASEVEEMPAEKVLTADEIIQKTGARVVETIPAKEPKKGIDKLRETNERIKNKK